MLLSDYKIYIDTLIDTYLIDTINNDNLKTYIKYSLNGGKRLRPIITLEIHKIITNSITDNIILSSIAVELLHNSSLILDDMPCMDNDLYRRGNKTVHNKYGISIANLLANFLLGKAFYIYNKCVDTYLLNLICKFTEDISLGQFFDLHSNLENMDTHSLVNYTSMKTYPLFSIAFVSGYLLGNGPRENIDLIIQISKSFSIVFQICDDFEDLEQDNKKTSTFIPNYVIFLGKDKSVILYNKHMDFFRENMGKLQLYSALFQEITNYLDNKIKNILNK